MKASACEPPPSSHSSSSAPQLSVPLSDVELVSMVVGLRCLGVWAVVLAVVPDGIVSTIPVRITLGLDTTDLLASQIRGQSAALP